MHVFLFVCTGNTCRSPMAEAIARQWIAEGGLGAPGDGLAVSAGVAAGDGHPASPESEQALAALGIPLDHRSRPLTPEMVRKATRVFTMTAGHLEAIRALVDDDAEVMARVELLDPEGTDVDDPIGRGQAAYDAVAERLLKLVPDRLRAFARAAEESRP